MTPLASAKSDVDAFGAEIVPPSYYDSYRVRFPSSMDIRDVVAHFQGLPWVKLVTVSQVLSLSTIRPAGEAISAPQETAKNPDGWQRAVNSSLGDVGDYRPVVAIIDTGIDIRNQDIAQNLWINPGEIAHLGIVDADGDGFITIADIANPVNSMLSPGDLNGNGYLDGDDILQSNVFADNVDQDGNCFTDDLFGWDFIGNDNDPTDQLYHGNGVAGIVGAANNGAGVLGQTHHVRLVGVRVLDSTGRGTNVSVNAGFQYVQNFGLNASPDNDINVANASLGQTWVDKTSSDDCSGCYVTRSEPEYGEITSRRLQELNFLANPVASMPDPSNTTCTFTPTGTPSVLWVIAAGNESANLDSGGTFGSMCEAAKRIVPDRTLIVASVNQSLGRSDFSNVGSNVVDIAAPGETWTLAALGNGTDTIAPNACPSPVGPQPCDGTSFASPVVTDTAALLISLDPTLQGEAATLRTRILDAAPDGVSGAAVANGNFLDLNTMLSNLGF